MSFVRVSKRFSIGYRSSRVRISRCRVSKKVSWRLLIRVSTSLCGLQGLGSVSEVDYGGHGQPRRPSP